jgi:hypothetical protein
MHTRWDHQRRQGHGAHCEMPCIQRHTAPFDEDVIEYQFREPVALCSVQVRVGAAVACTVGAMVEGAVGCTVGAMVGAAVGCIIGAMVEAAVGCIVGAVVGAAVGVVVGVVICRTQSGRSAQLSSEQQLLGADRSNPPASLDTPASPLALTVPSVPCSPPLIPHPSSPDLKCLPHGPAVPSTPLSQQPDLDHEAAEQALIVESSINGGEHEPRRREDTEGSNMSTQAQTRKWKAIERSRAVEILQRLALTFVRRQRKRIHLTVKEQEAAPCEADGVMEVAPALGLSGASVTVQALGPCCEARSSSPLAHPTSSVNQTCNAFTPEGDAWEAMRYWKPAGRTSHGGGP